MRILHRSLEIYRSEGIQSLLKSVCEFLKSLFVRTFPLCTLYSNYIRSRTRIVERCTVSVNSVKYHPNRRFDRYLPWDFAPDHSDEFESGTIEALEEHVQTDDEVAVVGGGRGITSVVAAQETGKKGSVIVYEGADHLVKQVRDTAELNDVSDRITVRHAIVGSLYRLDGPSRGAPTISASRLPECDILEMDCEGAETDILPALTVAPRKIIVESHGNSDQIRSQLSDIGYDIISETPAESRLSIEKIQQMGLYTIVAEYTG
jgi:hypothetical protein